VTVVPNRTSFENFGRRLSWVQELLYQYGHEAGAEYWLAEHQKLTPHQRDVALGNFTPKPPASARPLSCKARGIAWRAGMT